MKLLKPMMLAVVPFFVSACTQAGLFAANVPSSFSAVERHSDIAYGSGDLNTLDIYVPPDLDAPAPVVFFIHGGRWTDGNKDQYKFIGDRLARAGYVTVIPNYRKYPDVKFPELMVDEADALAWVHNNIAKYSGQGDVIHVIGHSSGAHVGALLVADKKYLNARDVPHSVLASFVGLSGPYHFNPAEPDLIDMFGPPSQYPQMQVTTFIDGTEPPMLLIWGAQDTLVGKINIDRLAPKILEKNGQVEIKIYDELDHIDPVKAFTLFYEGKSGLVDDVLDFLKAQNPSGKI